MVRGKLLVVAAVSIAALGGGIAWAAIPDGGGVIHGCYLKGLGTLRVIDPAKEHCSSVLETPLQWNAQGPQGPQGLQGVQGPPGPKGDKGDAGPTYGAGTGLGLSGTTFGIDGSYQLPQGCSPGQSAFLAGFPLSHPWSCFTAANADQHCASGTFANGIDASGDVTCDTPSGGGGGAGPGLWFDREIESQDTPNFVDTTLASVSLPAGSFLLEADGQAAADPDFAGDPIGLTCTFDPAGGVQSFAVGDGFAPFSLMDVVTIPNPGSVSLVCTSTRPHSHAANVIMTALEVGSVH